MERKVYKRRKKDPTKPGTKQSDTTKTKSGFTSHKIVSKEGDSIAVRGKAVEDARGRKNVFKKRPAYKGEIFKHKNGDIRGYKTHDGKYKAVQTPSERKKALEIMKKDRALHRKDSIDHENLTKRFQKGVYSPSTRSRG